MKKEIDLEKELDKFKDKLRKRYIDNMTSGKYQIPPDSKAFANFKWLEVAVVFDAIMIEMFNNK